MRAGLLAARARFSTVAVTLAGLAAAALTTLPTAPAAADTAPAAGLPATVSADPLPTVQIDGVVWDQVVVGNTVYATGNFSFARPAGTPASTSQRVARGRLLAYDIRTGNLITTFNASLNGTGRNLAVSPDGTRLYVAGEFTSVTQNGVTTTRNRAAAFDITTAAGPLVRDFNPNLSGTAFAVTATNTTAYFGGSFTSAAGVSRSRLAAYSRAGGLLTWNPGANSTVRAMVMSPDNSRVVVGGNFTTLARVGRIGIGTVLTTGTAGAWPSDFIIKDSGSQSNITSLVTDGTNVYGSAYYFRGGGNFEGRFGVEPNTGRIVFMNSCHGDSYDVAVIGQVLYYASHVHDCSDLNDFTQDLASALRATPYKLAAETTVPSGTLRRPVFTGGPGQPGPIYHDFSGRPHTTQLQFYPSLTNGSFTGQNQAAWSVAGNETYLAVGGEFPSVNGVAQQGLVRFGVRSAAPNRVAPTGLGTPSAVSLTSGTARVTWRAAWDRDNTDLTYQVFRDGGTTPIHTTTYRGSFWKRPVLGFTDAGLPVGSSHTYRVRVSDPLGNAVTSATSAPVTVGSASTPSYAAMVKADGASEFWRFNESSGTTARNSAGTDDMTLRAAVSFAGAAGPIPGQGTAATLAGTRTDTAATLSLTTTTSNNVASTTGTTDPLSSYTLEAWVRTTDSNGGLIMSNSTWAPTDGRVSVSLSRALYLGSDGRVSLGLFNNNGNRTVTSSSSIADGRWHHVAATVGAGGARIFVDGAQVGSNSALTSDEDRFTGVWRVGGDLLNLWSPLPSDPFLAGNLADVAVYRNVLGADRIAAHAAAGGGVATPTNAAPAAAFSSTCTDLSCSFDSRASADSDGSITRYAWNFGDDPAGTSTSANPTYTFPAAGTYTVRLTVTDDGGATGTTTRTVSVGSPAPARLATDTFSRTTTSGWGSADTGGAWTVNSTSRLTVNGGVGRSNLSSAGATNQALLNGVSASSTDVTLVTALDKVPTASTFLDVIGRRVAANQEYSALVRVNSNGAVQVGIRKLDGSAAAVNVVAPQSTGITYTPGRQLNVRVQTFGVGTTTIRAKVWVAGTAEPSGWTVTGTDTAAGNQGAGGVGLRSYIGGTATNTPILQTVDNLVVNPAG